MKPPKTLDDYKKPEDFTAWGTAAVKELNVMYRAAEKKTPTEAEAMIKHSAELNGYLARSGRLLAEAESYKNEAFAAALEELVNSNSKLSQHPTLLAKIALGKTKAEARIWRELEGLNKSLSKQIESIRTHISYEKEQLKNTPGGTH